MKKWKNIRYYGACCIAALYSSSALSLSGENWSLGGQLKYGESIAYDLEYQGSSEGPKSYLAQLDFNWFASDQWVVAASFWLRGDNNANNGDAIRQNGIMDYTSPNYLSRFGFNINGKGSGFPEEPHGAYQDGLEQFDDFDNDVIRELSIKYSDPAGRFAVKVGKFQRGWGQSDGLRLLDLLHPQDLRERFVMRDAADIRIPTWMASVDLDFERMGLSAPFEAIGLQRPELELIYIPEVRHSQIYVNNPTPSSATSGGIWGLPWPALVDSQSGKGIPFVGINLYDKEWDDSVTNGQAEYGVRFKFHTLGAEWTLNALKGYQDLPVVKLQGSSLLVGTTTNDPSQALAVVPFDAAATVNVVHGPGGYLDFLRLGSAGGGTGGLVDSLFGALNGDQPWIPFGCQVPVVGLSACSINMDYELDYTEEQKVVGFSMTRDMTEIGFGPKHVSPVLRIEMAHEIDKAFNKAVVTTPFGAVEQGTSALVIEPEDTIEYRDQTSLMVGVDYFLWIPGWDSQRKAIFTSFQFFNIHTSDGEELLYQAPYAANDSRLPEDHNYATLLWFHGFFDERLVFESLSVKDIDFDGFMHRARLDFNFFGDNIRPRLEWVHADGKDEQGVIGLFNHSDYVEASISVQF